MRILLLFVLTALVAEFNCKVFIEITGFSRVGETQYFIHSSAQVPKKNIGKSSDLKDVVLPICSVGQLDGNTCKEYLVINEKNLCPTDAVFMENKCIKFHSPRCPSQYTNVDGKCLLDQGCDPKFYDQVGKICYEKCTSNYRRYYSNLCITESKSCPIQFRSNGSDCVLSECPTQMRMTEDEKGCESSCPKFFKKGNNAMCESDTNICPVEYKRKKDLCIIQRCKYGLLLNGVCLDTICPTGYELSNNLCRKCFTSTHTVCSEIDWKCPMGLIELGSGPTMKCVMICPRNYAQFGKHCYDISVTGCPEGFLHFNDQGCIKASNCPANYEVFGNECLKKAIDSGYVINGRIIEECPLNYVEYNGHCLKLITTSCPDEMYKIEDSPFCISSCPKGFKLIGKVCLVEVQCRTMEFSFMDRCYEKCPMGTFESNETKSCKVSPHCDGDQVLDLTKFKCVFRDKCNISSFISPDGKLCHRKDQCNTQGYILDQYCVASCPLEYEVSTQFCKKKSTRCSRLSLLNGTCVDECPEGHVPKNQICIEVQVNKKNILCGLNKELKTCSSLTKDCTNECVCKEGFGEVKGQDYCIPIEKNCPSHHLLDLVFIIDGSSDINEASFNEIKFSLMEAVTHLYSSKIDVRVGIIIYGPTKPQLILLHKTIHLCDCMILISKITYVDEAQGTTLIDGFRMVNEIILTQCNGARVGSVRQIVVISKFAEFSTDERGDLVQEINLNKDNGHRLTFITIGKITDIPKGIYILESESTKDISVHTNKLFEIACKDISCPKGYQKIGENCIDIDECDSKACHENSICINTPGAFICYCKEDKEYQGREPGCGYSIKRCELKIKQTVCDSITCKSPAKCSTSNGLDFCICPRGFIYKEEQGCIDIDECKINPCLGKANCFNTNGSFDCSCNKGFNYNVNFGCIDIDECEDNTKCSGNGICQNLLGSYRCACHSGYEYIANQGCIDIDECKHSKNLCQGDNVLCLNTPGSFKCSCPTGYEYKDKGCIDIDECKTNNTCPEGSLCKNNVGGFTCSCANGFIFSNITNTCELDETLNVIKPKADLIFGVDASLPIKGYMTEVKDMLKNIIIDYKLKSIAVLKSYFALTIGGDNDVKIIYSKETDNNVLNRTDEIAYLGGNSLLSRGLQSCRNLYVEKGQVNSSKLVVFITATKPGNYSAEEILNMKKEVKKIMKEARLLIIYIGENVQSNEWKIIFKDNEIEEHVIVVSHDFISTIHKVIYQRTDRLIKCPDGFVFLDKVCQYKTLQAKYCKWDDKLYAFNSSWTSSCAVYRCAEDGVTVVETNCLGFDGECYKENQFFPCNVNGKLNWRCRCNIVKYFEEETKKTQQRIDYIIIDFDQNATINNTKLEDEKGKCVLPFKYQDKWFYACTDSQSYNRWCSNYMFYKPGHFSYCARQVTSQCIFDGKVYKEGDKWNVGCNVIVCDSGKPYVTARCTTTNGTCVPLNADNYPCEFKGDNYSSCMCLQDNFGYGENTAIRGKITGEKKKNTKSGLVQFCEHQGTGNKYELGQTWVIDCFKMECEENGIAKIIERNCSSSDQQCYSPKSTQSFPCVIGGERKLNCQCKIEDDELVLVSNEGGKAEKAVVKEKKKILSILN